MRIPRDIIDGLTLHVETEIQGGRRLTALDRDIVSAFLAISDEPKSKAVPTHSRTADAVTQPVAFSATATEICPIPPPPTVETPRLPSIEAIADAVATCKRCGLYEGRTNTVPGAGNSVSPEIMFIGEGPRAEEDACGMPFVGPAGQLLTKMIEAMGFDRESVYITSIVKCKLAKGKPPTPAEVEACMPWLHNQIQLIKPKCIVALGATALSGLTGKPTVNITKDRGIWQKYGSIPLLPTFHPAYLLRFPAAKKNPFCATYFKLSSVSPYCPKSASAKQVSLVNKSIVFRHIM